MNVIRLTGDLLHLYAIIFLLVKIWQTRSCAGISGKSQLLFAIVYMTRYLDVFKIYISAYNFFMKIIFIATSYVTIFLIYVKFISTYNHDHDTFRIEILLISSALLALVINYDFSVLEILWSFSIYLESVAILPQLFLMSKTDEAESVTLHYLFTLGCYRGLYILNWIYRYFDEGRIDYISTVAGLVQTILYCDFFYCRLITPTIVGTFLSSECVEQSDHCSTTFEVTGPMLSRMPSVTLYPDSVGKSNAKCTTEGTGDPQLDDNFYLPNLFY